MHPVPGETLPDTMGLGSLVLVMREDQIQSPTVDVELRAEVSAGHGRAFDVPAGPAPPPGRCPERLTRLCRLPEREISGVPLVAAGPRLTLHHFVDAPAGEESVVGLGTNGEIYISVRGVGMAGRDQLGNHFQDLRNVAGGPRFDGRAQATQDVVGVVEA